jgi:hypothetical protein
LNGLASGETEQAIDRSEFHPTQRRQSMRFIDWDEVHRLADYPSVVDAIARMYSAGCDAMDRMIMSQPTSDGDEGDFLMQPATTMSAASSAGATNIKVASVADLATGQTIIIDSDGGLETAVIATVGTAGATTVGAATSVGATVIPVAGGLGFTAGQTITIDSGANQETAVVASTTGGGRGPGRGGAGPTITVTAPLKIAHAASAQVSGSGIILTAALTKPHASGAQVASDLPTPGAPNRYYRASARR